MLTYVLSDIIATLIPFIGNALSMLLGVIVANIFWKARIHRYAKTEVVETLEYQKNKIDYLEHELIEKNTIISDLRGCIQVTKISVLKIIEVMK